tara:strand:+ start:380 stop:1438 length:1059 start_codon:yes stop_codon:yes gene_type:complete
MSKAAELAALIGSQTALSNRNLIINSAMQVAQRGTSAVAAANDYATVDRFEFFEGTDGAYTSEQSSTTPDGFANSLKLAVTTADGTLATGQYAYFLQAIEAQNLQHLKYGTVSAESVTLSFWVRSSKTGTYCIAVDKNDSTRYHFIKEYSISVADTWEHKTITISPDSNIKASGGAIANDNGLGFRVFWWLAAGDDFDGGTDNTWTSTTSDFTTSNQVNWMDSTSNTFYITGVQLEVGETATPFEHRTYGDELRRCQRYYYQTTDYIRYMSQGPVGSQAWEWIDLPVTMRAQPTGLVYGNQNEADVGKAQQDGGDKETVNLYQSPFVLGLICPTSTSGQNLQFWKIKVDAEL